MSDSEDTIGCIVGAAVVVGGGWWLYNNYEIRKRVPDAPVPVISTPVTPALPRPTGDIEISTTDSGSRWILDADSVSGSRKARQAWVTIDASKDKTASYRTSKTLYLVDCDTTAARTLSTANYEADKGYPSFSQSFEPKDAKADYYPPSTMGASVVRRICNADFDR